MPTCKYCGKNIASDSVICPYCDKRYPFGKKNAVRSNSSYFSTPNYVITEPISSKNKYTQTEHRNSGTGYAITGFIFAFLMPIIGLVLSAIGLRCTTYTFDKLNRGLSLAGIVISILAIIAWIFALLYIFLV